jgi:hypothetical protein
MPLETIPIADIKSFINSNKNYHWPNRKRRNRLEPVCRPQFNPSFQIEDHDKVFCIGSCFALNIQQELLNVGINILPLSLTHEFSGEGWSLNQYSPVTILQSFKWALEPQSMPENSSCFMDMGNGYTFDPTLHYAEARKKETVIWNSARVTKINSMVNECRIVIITLGLIECIYDKKLGVYLNGFPIKSIQKIDKERYEIRILNYPEILESLEELHGLLARNMTDDFKILVTISPVPLTFTYRKSDVIEANTYSKSVLRAVAEEFSNKHSNVDYLPIYESVSLSDRVVSWDWDLRHVSKFIVKLNITRMLAVYLSKKKAVKFKEHEERLCNSDIKLFEEQFIERIPENMRLMDQEFYSRELELNLKFNQRELELTNKIDQIAEEKFNTEHKLELEVKDLKIEALTKKVERLQNINTQYLQQIHKFQNI